MTRAIGIRVGCSIDEMQEADMEPSLRSARMFLAVLIALGLAACGGAATDAPSTAGPLQDDFSSATCPFGFLEAGSTQGYECVDGEFRAWIDNDQATYDFISAPGGESYEDVRIEVDARIVSAVPYGGVVVLCRGSQASGDYYSFTLSSGGVELTDTLDGEEQISRYKDLPAGVMQPDWNHLRVDCIGNHLAIYVNGTLALDRDIDELAQGDVGLGAGGASEGQTEVRFDNLVVSQP
jgi:hypothetical protein